MSAASSKPHVSIEDYLRFERASLERHEYVDGDVFAMAGESPTHGDITANLMGTLVPQLRGTPCRARTKDTKVLSGPPPQSRTKFTGLFSYPDVLVICGEPEYHDQHQDVVLNPKVLIEVLSESTEAFDRGGKFTRYQKWNPGLTDYIWVSQDQAQIAQFIWQPDGTWTYHRYSGLDFESPIVAIGRVLRAGDVFDRVSFPPPEL